MKARTLIFTAIALVLCAAGCKKEETPKVTPSLKVSGITDNTITVGSEGGSATFTVTANVDWSVSSTGTWVSVTPASTKISDGKETTTTVTVTILPSTDGKARSAELSVGADNVNLTPVKITVKQTEKIDIIFEADSYVFLFSADAITDKVIITANKSWAFKSINEDWITVEPESKDITFGTKTTTDVKISVKKNETTDAREAKLYVQCEGAEDLMLNISQDAGSNSITIYDSDVKEISSAEFGCAGGMMPIIIDTDSKTAPEVSSGADWLTFVTTEEFVPGEFWNATIVADVNATAQTREGTILFKVKGNDVALTVKQEQGATFKITVSDISFATAVIAVTPSTDDLGYFELVPTLSEYQKMIDSGATDAEILEALFEYYLGYGYEPADLLEFGPTEYYYSLDPETEYIVMCGAMTEEGKVISPVSKETFKTLVEPAPESEYTELIGTWKVKGNSAKYNSSTGKMEIVGTDDIAWTAVVEKDINNQSYYISFPIAEEEVSPVDKKDPSIYDYFPVNYIPSTSGASGIDWLMFYYGSQRFYWDAKVEGQIVKYSVIWACYDIKKLTANNNVEFTWNNDKTALIPTLPEAGSFVMGTLGISEANKSLGTYSGYAQITSMEKIDEPVPTRKTCADKTRFISPRAKASKADCSKKKFNCVERIPSNYRIK